MSLEGGGVDVLDSERREIPRSSFPDLPGVAGISIDEQDDLVLTSDRAAAQVFEEHA